MIKPPESLADFVSAEGPIDMDGPFAAKARELLALGVAFADAVTPLDSDGDRPFNIATNGVVHAAGLLFSVAELPPHETVDVARVRRGLLAMLIANELANDWCCTAHAIEQVGDIAQESLTMLMAIMEARASGKFGLGGVECAGSA